MSLAMVVVLFALFILNVPVAFSILAAAVTGFALSGIGSIELLGQRFISGMNSFVMLTVPFFVAVGLIMNQGGITSRIFRFASTLVGHIRGGLGHVNIVASLIFSGISGSGQADAAGLGQIEMEGMKEAGYPVPFSAAVTAASATIGPIFPPSIILVVYGAISGASVGALLLAGIIPGLLIAALLMVTVYVISLRAGYPAGPWHGLRAVWKSFVECFWALLTPVVLLVGILHGAFTPSEAGAVAVAYSLFVTMVIYRELRPRDLPQLAVQILVLTAGIMVIIAAASPFGWILTWAGVPQALTSLTVGIAENRVALLLLINAFALLAGMFMEGLAILTIMVPLLLPVATNLGVDPVHFGVILCFNLMIGSLTPPLGVLSYIACMIARIDLLTFSRAVLPFIAALLVGLLLVTFIPSLSLGVPRLLLRY